MTDSTSPIATGWRCFHCDAQFTDENEAREHFGGWEHSQPACHIDIAKYRQMEATLSRWQNEDTDLHRAMYGMQSKHATDLIREEEKGYARGLRDAVAGKLWLWKNFVDGKPEYWAFDNPYPVGPLDDDPQTLGEPCGYAIFKPSRQGRKDASEEQVLNAIRRASPPAPAAPSIDAAPANEWEEAQRISDLPQVDEMLRNFVDDPTGDGAVCVVREVLRAFLASPPGVAAPAIKEDAPEAKP